MNQYISQSVDEIKIELERCGSVESHVQRVVNDFNNIHILFLDGVDGEYRKYIEKTKRKHNDAFNIFLKENQALVDEIHKFLRIHDMVESISSVVIQLVNKDREKAMKLARETNIVFFEEALWYYLNPLLEQAGRKLMDLGFTKEDLRM